MPKGLFHDRSDDNQEAKKQKAAYPFPVEMIDQLLAQVENKDAGSIFGESGLARQLKKMLAERMLSAELSHHLANEDEGSKNHRNGSNPKKVLTPGGELNLDVLRDHLSSFEPKTVVNHQLNQDTRVGFPSPRET